MKIRFIRKTDERVHGAAYSEGDVVDLPYLSAMRWLRRHLAVEVKPEPEPVRLKGRPMMGVSWPSNDEPSPAEEVKADSPKAEDAPEPPRRGRRKKKGD